MPAPDQRPDNREVENEELRPDGDGRPPRPRSEPRGSKPSQVSDKTLTDPGSGAPNPDAPRR